MEPSLVVALGIAVAVIFIVATALNEDTLDEVPRPPERAPSPLPVLKKPRGRK